MSLNVARERLLLGAALDARAGGEVAVGDAPRGAVEAADRPRDLAGHERAREQRRARARARRSATSPSHARRTARSTASTLCEMRTAPIVRPARDDRDRGERGASRPSVSERALALVGAARAARPRSRAAPAYERPGGRALGVGEQVAARVDDDHAAADVRRRGVDEPLALAPRRRRRARSATDAATTSACARACERTSASIRSATLEASGTSSATIASTST